MTPEETTTAMLGTNIYLTHRVADARYREQLAAAERRRSVSIVRGGRPRTRRTGLADARAAVATLLLRASSWLMPEESPDACTHPVAFELWPGQ
jgi:hypothetical protein